MFEGSFKGSDGVDLYEWRWAPEGECKAAVVIVHGYGHYGGSFASVAQHLNSHGYAVYAFDQRGAGRSSGKRGAVKSFDTTLNDMDCYLKHIASEVDAVPTFLLGHSYGGLILANYVVSRKPDVKGLLFSSALVKMGDDVSKALQALAGILAVLTPWLPVTKVDVSGISRDPEIVAHAMDDPHGYYESMTAQTGAQIANAIKRIQGTMDQIALPMLLLAGTGDRIVDCKGSQQLHDSAASTDKTLKLYEDGYHELYNDIIKDEFLGDIVAWLDSHR
ncbi:MAG: alpha/beta hydrolase [bacterium]|nr:alpha/beta hydrolase [bacterium]